MSRPLGLARPLALLIAVLSLTMLTVAPANASDKTLRRAVVSAAKQLGRTTTKIEEQIPEDKKSPTFAEEFTAVLEQYDAAFVRFGERVEAERGSTGNGRKARKLVLKSVDFLQRCYALTGKLVLAEAATGVKPTKDEDAEVGRLCGTAQRDMGWAYKLLEKTR